MNNQPSLRTTSPARFERSSGSINDDTTVPIASSFILDGYSSDVRSAQLFMLKSHGLSCVAKTYRENFFDYVSHSIQIRAICRFYFRLVSYQLSWRIGSSRSIHSLGSIHSSYSRWHELL
jgi:hypothetical protein